LNNQIVIKSRQGDYKVDFVSNVSELSSLSVSNETFVVADALVYELYSAQLGKLTDLPTYLVDANEETKTIEGVSNLVDWLLKNKATRSANIIALGGGVIQDLVTFTAHIYYRGVSWTFLPTTLLSQSDSCIGAKCGINVLPLKNQLGVLHSPSHVVICSAFLETLPSIEIDSGYGEIYKLSLTGSGEFFQLLEKEVSDNGHKNSQILELTRLSLIAKQEIIEEDEYESDLRRVLNYGHSFGHALEALTHNQVPHGIAVMWGIDIINFLGEKWGISNPEIVTRVKLLIENTVDFQIEEMPSASDFVRMLGRDKKVENGLMNFAVMHEIGDIRIHSKALDEDLVLLVQEYLDGKPLFTTS
jgi:3-dehydroquinate synthase